MAELPIPYHSPSPTEGGKEKAPPKRGSKLALPSYEKRGLLLIASLPALAGLLGLLAGILLATALLAALAGLIFLVLLARIALAAALLALIAHRAFLLVLLGHRKLAVKLKLAQGNRRVAKFVPSAGYVFDCAAHSLGAVEL